MKYMVRANVPFGPDDTYDCEYSGVEHQLYLSTENSVKSSLKIQSLLLEISASFLEAFFCGLCPHPPLVGEAGKQHLTASRHTG